MNEIKFSGRRTLRQLFMHYFQHAVRWVLNIVSPSRKKILERRNVKAGSSIYELKIETLKGEKISLLTFRGKYILIVNSASDCGYTSQYDLLEKLQERYRSNLVVLAFPSGDFKNQEFEKNEDIKTFCERNFSLTYLVMKKSNVKGKEANELFHWCADEKQNGWNTQPPSWNFCKYLIDKNGNLIGYYASGISPLNKHITKNFNT